jgi:hypothetical protein
MIHGAGQSTAGLALGLAASMATGVIIYLCANLVFGSPEVRLLLAALKGRVRVR